MATDVRGHTVPAATEPPRRQALLDLSLSIRDIVYVANSTARAQLVVDLTTAGHAPSPTRPLYVHRGDAPAGQQLEQTVDGTTWRCVFAADTAWTPLPIVASWSTGSSILLRRCGPQVLVKGRVLPNTGVVPAAQTSIGTAPAQFRPLARAIVGGVGVIGGATPPYRGNPALTIEPSGEVIVSATEGLSWAQFDGANWFVD